MDIKLDASTEKLIAKELKAGRFPDATALVETALRHYFIAREFGEEYAREEIDEKIARGLRQLDEGKSIDGEQFFAVETPGAVAFGLKATGFDFSAGRSPLARLRTFPSHQFDFDLAVQGVRHADQRANGQVARFILHRRYLGSAHFRLGRQFGLA